MSDCHSFGMPVQITFAQLCVWFYGLPWDPPRCNFERDLRQEIQQYYLDSFSAEWHDAFWNIQQSVEDDVIYRGLTVTTFIVFQTGAQVCRLGEMSTEEWWAFSFTPHASLLLARDAANIADLPQPPVPTWPNDRRMYGSRQCNWCGTTPTWEVEVKVHHTGILLCQRCVNSNYEGIW